MHPTSKTGCFGNTNADQPAWTSMCTPHTYNNSWGNPISPSISLIYRRYVQEGLIKKISLQDLRARCFSTPMDFGDPAAVASSLRRLTEKEKGHCRSEEWLQGRYVDVGLHVSQNHPQALSFTELESGSGCFFGGGGGILVNLDFFFFLLNFFGPEMWVQMTFNVLEL